MAKMDDECLQLLGVRSRLADTDQTSILLVNWADGAVCPVPAL